MILITFNYDTQYLEGTLRIGQLRLGIKQLNTPNWVITQMKRKRLIKGLNIIDHSPRDINLHEIIFDYKTDNEVRQLLSNNQNINNQIIKIRNESRRNTENIFQYRIARDIRLNLNDLHELIRIQAETESLSVITIPDPIIGESGLIWESIMVPAI